MKYKKLDAITRPTNLKGFRKMTPEEQKKYVEYHGHLLDSLTVIENENRFRQYDRKIYFFLLRTESFWVEEKVECQDGQEVSRTLIAFPDNYNTDNWKIEIYKSLSAIPCTPVWKFGSELLLKSMAKLKFKLRSFIHHYKSIG